MPPRKTPSTNISPTRPWPNQQATARQDNPASSNNHVNKQIEKEFEENPPWDKAPVNEVELEDPEGLASYKETMKRAQELRNDAAVGLGAGLLADLVVAGAAEGAAGYAAGLEASAINLELCVQTGKAIGGKEGSWGTCFINEKTFLGVPIEATAEFCAYQDTRSWGKKSHNYYYCVDANKERSGPWY